MNRTLNAVLALATSVSLVGPALAAGKQPVGKPFIQIQEQIIEVENAVTTLDERIELIREDILVDVSTLEGQIEENRQAQAIINLSIDDLQLQLSLGTDSAAIEQTIADLQAENAILEALPDPTQAELDLIALNNTTIGSLQEQLGGLTALEDRIVENEEMIAIIEGQIVELETDLAIKQNIVSGTCNAGFSLVAIETDGSVICEQILHPEPVAPGQLVARLIQVNRSTGNTGLDGFSTVNIFCSGAEVAVNSGYFSVNGKSNVVGSFTSGTKAQIRMNQPTAGFDNWTQAATCIRIAP